MLSFLNMGVNASILLRVVAKIIDFLIIFTAAEALNRAGWLAGLCYLLISDGLMDGRSIGKRLVGTRALGSQGAPCTIKESILRNSTLAIGLLLWKVPFIGWIFPLLISAFELVILLGSPDRMRIGDEIANTSVVQETGAIQES